MNSFQNTDFSTVTDAIIFLDIDGTLINDDEFQVTDETIAKVSELKMKNQVCLCSNSRNHERNRKVAELVQADYIDTDLRKPDKKILDLVDHSPFSRRVVIGDKFMTDGIFAKNIKAEFIKVSRIESESDRLYIKFLYWFDDVVSKLIKI